MQIEIYNPTQAQPLPPIQWNFEELKAQLAAALESYKGRVYTDKTISNAKKDRAVLNKLESAIDGKRKEMKALYLAPYAEFEAQAKELTAMVKEQSAAIDAQIKEYEDFRRQEKQAAIMELYNANVGDLAELVPYERLHDPKWLNVTTSMNAIECDILKKLGKIAAGFAAINGLKLDTDMAAAVKRVFMQNYDLSAALMAKDGLERERERLEKYEASKREREAAFAEREVQEQTQETKPAEPAEPVKEEAPAQLPVRTVIFRVEATDAQLAALKAFLKSNNIKYGRP